MVTSNFVCRFVAPVSLGSCNNQSAITQPKFLTSCAFVFSFHVNVSTTFIFVDVSSTAFVMSDFHLTDIEKCPDMLEVTLEKQGSGHFQFSCFDFFYLNRLPHDGVL